MTNAQFNAMMVGLRQKYLAQLKERRPEVAEFIKACQEHRLTDQERQLMRQYAHSFAGSGATYGFADISHAGRALEDAIDAKKSETELIPLAQTLLEVCHKALTLDTDSTATASTPKTVSASSRHMKLLTADDDPAVRDLMVGLFKDEAEVLTATNGKEALEMIRKHRPDLVLLDDMMPEITGMKLIEMLQQDSELSATAVIMLTASDRSKDIMRAISAGAIDYITKPFDPQTVARKVRALMKRFSQTVLIADDDASIRDLLAAKFRANGIKVLEAKDGEEALKLMQKYKPQLAILDRMMPGLDGFALLQKLKTDQHTKDIPVIFLTAKRQEKDIVDGLKLGAADYIVKPFSPEEVMMRCMRLLGVEMAA